jgi:hypothetical protein
VGTAFGQDALSEDLKKLLQNAVPDQLDIWAISILVAKTIGEVFLYQRPPWLL